MTDSTRRDDTPFSDTRPARDSGESSGSLGDTPRREFGDSSGDIGDTPRRRDPAVGPGDAPVRESRSARDFGDSAGYGSGGSTRDYRDVVGEDERRLRRPNPLDAVMTIPPHRRRTFLPRAARIEGHPSSQIALAALALMAGSLAVLAWNETQARRERERLRALDRRGSAREDLARLQV